MLKGFSGILGFLFLFLATASTAQKGKEFYLIDSINTNELDPGDKALIDSVLSLYHKTSQDTEKVNLLARIVESCNDESVWPRYNTYMHDFSKQKIAASLDQVHLNFFKGKLADAINNFGFLKINTGEVDGALSDFTKSYELQKELGNKKGMTASLGNIGYIYKYKGNIFKALDYYHKSLAISEQINDLTGIANCYNNIGLLYKNQGETTKALEYYQKSYARWKKLDNPVGMAASLNNIGFIYQNQKKYLEALKLYEECLRLDTKNGDELGRANSLNNIGLIHEGQGNLSKALKYYEEALKINEAIGSKKGQSEVLNNIAKIFFDQQKKAASFELAKRSLTLARDLGYPTLISDASSLLYDIYRASGDWKNACLMKELNSQMKDSILNSETQKATIRQQMKYEHEKQQAEDRLEQQKQRIVQQEEKKRQTLVSWATGSGLILMMVFAGFIYSRFRISQRQQRIIEQQKHTVDLAYDQLSEKNREIIDSIHYAKKIQTALLKEQEHVSKHLPEHFILFKPKDIVSGDFYWSYERDGFWYLAAADCTGHGVPGAFLTMLGTAFLNEIVSSLTLPSPAHILDELRVKFVKELSQSGKSEQNINLLKDGMDISLLRLELGSRNVEWAGANNGLCIFRNENGNDPSLGFEPIAGVHGAYVQPDKQPIGLYHKTTAFTNHRISLLPGDTVYLFTDGYADQFGGPQGKKLKFRTLQAYLAAQQSESLTDQKKFFNTKFDEWRGQLEQVDDVTLIGLRVS